MNPGLLFLAKHNQKLSLGGLNETCSGGTVTSAVIKTQGTAPLETIVSVNCQTLLATAGTTSAPVWNGRIVATWNPGMGSTVMNITAKITSSVGHSTSFHFSGKTEATTLAGSPFKGLVPVKGNFTINKGLNAIAAGGDCSSLTKLTSGAITASNLRVNA